ncbi:MAG: DUF3808 domain-containing protein [Deltaproteobacteria bacterium]|nr:DUF3808 domain-containing protein [Deltaproteobacteria bacterium]
MSVDETIRERVAEGQERLFERKYDEAKKEFTALQRDFPTSPAGYFGEMAVHAVYMLEREDFSREAAFRDAAKRGERAVSHTLQRYAPSNFELLYCGSYYGLKGFQEARRSKWFQAYFFGTESRQLFKRILNKAPQFVDAKFGMGMYLYWRTVFAKRLSFIPFLSDRRSEGIAILQEVAGKGVLTKHLARLNLGLVNLEEGRYKDAEAIFATYARQYPNNLIFHSFLGRSLMLEHQFDRALQIFRRMTVIDPTLHRPHYFIALNLIFKNNKALYKEADAEFEIFLKTEKLDLWKSYVHYWRGFMAEKLGEKQKAQNEYREAVRLNKELEQAKFRMRGLGGGL